MPIIQKQSMVIHMYLTDVEFHWEKLRYIIKCLLTLMLHLSRQFGWELKCPVLKGSIVDNILCQMYTCIYICNWSVFDPGKGAMINKISRVY